MNVSSPIEHVSDTAYWVASYRALESERKDALFHDPFAKVLTGEYGNKIAKAMSTTARYSYWTLVIRTLLIDELIQNCIKTGCDTVINLGAGLDTRPYRLNLPKNIQWIELDFPQIIDFKNEKLKNESPHCNLERIAVDLSVDEQRRSIFAELNQKVNSAIVLTEGVIPYLTEAVVSELSFDLKAQHNFKYWISEYYSPKVYPRIQTKDFQQSLGKAPFQFFPNDWFPFFEANGWNCKELVYLYDVAEKAGRKFPLPWWASALRMFASKDQLAEKLRLTGYVIFEKK